jgi:predicted dehydrogenase
MRRSADEATMRRYFRWATTERFGSAYADWLDAIRAGGQPETSGAEGLRDLATAFAIPEAALAGRAVKVDEVLDGSVDAYQREINAYYRL